jgi:hypothetical protein
MTSGRLAERLKAAVLKTADPLQGPRVRIPDLPPFYEVYFGLSARQNCQQEFYCPG